MTSVGVVATAFRVWGKLSVWATTSRSLSAAKIFAIPTRKMASESARIIRTGLGFASSESCFAEGAGAPDSRALSARWVDLVAHVECLDALELVFIDDYRN